MTDAMSPTDPVPELELVAQLERSILAVPGVDEVYRARPSVGAVTTHLRRISGAHALTPIPRVVVDDGVVRVSIGTDGALPAPAVARAVHDTVMAEATALGLAVERVDVTIARVG
jgi:hypothetical protein